MDAIEEKEIYQFRVNLQKVLDISLKDLQNLSKGGLKQSTSNGNR